MNRCVAWEKKIETNAQGLLAVVEFERLLSGKLGEDNQGYVAE